MTLVVSISLHMMFGPRYMDDNSIEINVPPALAPILMLSAQR